MPLFGKLWSTYGDGILKNRSHTATRLDMNWFDLCEETEDATHRSRQRKTKGGFAPEKEGLMGGLPWYNTAQRLIIARLWELITQRLCSSPPWEKTSWIGYVCTPNTKTTHGRTVNRVVSSVNVSLILLSRCGGCCSLFVCHIAWEDQKHCVGLFLTTCGVSPGVLKA